MGLKTRQAQTGKMPFMLVLGDKEIESGSVSVRKYGEQKSDTLTRAELMSLFENLDAEKIPAALREVF
jgi:threonyl-tRNA synthetase